MAALETAAHIIQLGGGEKHASAVAQMRSAFEARTGAFQPEDTWFEERSRAFWTYAITRGRFGRLVATDLGDSEAAWLGPLERAHRGLFRTQGRVLVDVWSGAELVPTVIDDASRAELDASTGQLFDACLVGGNEPLSIALIPGATFHPRHATVAIEPVLAAARSASLSTHDTLDALLRMERSLRALARVKAAYAYRPEALSAGPPGPAVRTLLKRPT